MKKNQAVLAIAFCLTTATLHAQTLITYGSHKIDAADFMKAYEKNNTNTDRSAQNIDNYLQLYINSRLKIQEAYRRGYDTLAQQKEDLANLRAQIVDNYMNDPETLNKLTSEAFRRSQKDIRVSHIYTAFSNTNGQTDTTEAYKKIKAALAQLQKGQDFANVAQQFSDDPSVQQNKGDIGYITVFNLPYEMENIVYNTPVGKFSGIYRSKHGYHIFKNTGERKALGRIKAAQILLAVPPNADAATKDHIAKLADSLYTALQNGADFEKLAGTYSNDFISASAGGLMPEFGVGQFEPAFETKVYDMPMQTVSKPFQTTHGYHIIKKLAEKPVVSDITNKENMAELKSKVQQNDRMNITQQIMYDRVVKKAGLKKMPYDAEEYKLLTDSLLDYKTLPRKIKMNRETVLYQMGDKKLTMNDWIQYAQTYRYKTDGTGMKDYNQLVDEWLHDAAKEYYRNHLEDYNPEFRRQLAEFREGNLFFEIMQKEIWSRAQEDTAALKNYFNQHKADYKWAASADAVVFYCGDEATATQLQHMISRSPAGWKEAAASYGERVVVDSGRFEYSQIPGLTAQHAVAGEITQPVLNETDRSGSFAYIIRLHNGGEPRNFAEARGLVLNDYQDYLEKQWMTSLRKKYPVTVNQKLLHSLYK